MKIDFLRKYVDSHGFWAISNPEQRETAEHLCKLGELRICSSLIGWPNDFIPNGSSDFYVPSAIKSIQGMPHSLWCHLVEGVV